MNELTYTLNNINLFDIHDPGFIGFDFDNRFRELLNNLYDYHLIYPMTYLVRLNFMGSNNFIYKIGWTIDIRKDMDIINERYNCKNDILPIIISNDRVGDIYETIKEKLCFYQIDYRKDCYMLDKIFFMEISGIFSKKVEDVWISELYSLDNYGNEKYMNKIIGKYTKNYISNV